MIRYAYNGDWMNKILEFIARKYLLKRWYGRVTLHIEDGRITRLTTDRSYSAEEIENAMS